mmetsp:Transcript_29922/g.67922  ORF Transcript_29922/g.67922 Transcript_29922/m.67922 type:complete len:346 (+) Transcript_29922:46-1083(+)
MMNQNMNRNAERGLAMDKAGAKPSGVTKRRPLGDITNAVTEDDFKGEAQNKKALFKAGSNITVAESKEDLFEDRPYMQRAIDDIDGRDVDNPLLVTCYVNEMYEHFNEMERDFNVNCNYMAKQEAVNEKMRAILADWLVEVHLKFKMVPESLYMTVSIIDRYLELKQVRRSKLQLVGVAALLIAAKYEEIYPPELRDLVYITDRAYNKQEILEMESEIVNTLEYKFTVPTVHSFLCRYLKAAHADRTMVQLACYLTERTLQEYTMLRFLPSTIAATAVMVARKSLNRHPWSPTLMKYTNMDERDLLQCAEEMRATIVDPANEQQAVYRKYSSSKFGTVAKMALMF